jgi:hypothetical protein
MIIDSEPDVSVLPHHVTSRCHAPDDESGHEDTVAEPQARDGESGPADLLEQPCHEPGHQPEH